MYNEEQNPPSTDLFFPQHPLILISITNCLMVALVLVPTRELCLQVYGIAQQLVHRFHWIVPGYVMGGENRAKEKARLRKGISCSIKSSIESNVPLCDVMRWPWTFVSRNINSHCHPWAPSWPFAAHCIICLFKFALDCFWWSWQVW